MRRRSEVAARHGAWCVHGRRRCDADQLPIALHRHSLTITTPLVAADSRIQLYLSLSGCTMRRRQAQQNNNWARLHKGEGVCVSVSGCLSVRVLVGVGNVNNQSTEQRTEDTVSQTLSTVSTLVTGTEGGQRIF